MIHSHPNSNVGTLAYISPIFLYNKEYDGKVIKALGKLYFFLGLIYIGNSDLFESIVVDDHYITKKLKSNELLVIYDASLLFYMMFTLASGFCRLQMYDHVVWLFMLTSKVIVVCFNIVILKGNLTVGSSFPFLTKLVAAFLKVQY